MKVGPFFKWFGSKWSSAKRYPKPEFPLIIEPYGGGAGYSCNNAELSVIIMENHPRLIDLWSWLISEASPSNIMEIPINVPEGTDIRTLGLSYGQQLLLKTWQRTNNVSECWTISQWGNKPGQWTASTRSRLAEEVEAIKHWKLFTNFDFNHHGVSNATWFIDPPYQFNYNYGCKNFDFSKLAEFVNTLPDNNQIIACEAIGKNGEVPNYLPFKFNHESVTSRRKESQSHHSKELVYHKLNGIVL